MDVRSLFLGLTGYWTLTVAQSHPAVAHIAPMGFGKTIDYLLPACHGDYRQTLVVTPLVAIKCDVVCKCKAIHTTTTVAEFRADDF
jgi:superfamily II DNA helicase RecQ